MSAPASIPALISTLRAQRLNLQTLTSSITSTPPSNDNTNNSDIFTPTFPAALSVELLHYKELFSQLRFSYLEQITKEKFLRDIAEDPPTIREAAENALRETEVAAAKQQLKLRKREVEELLRELEGVAARLANGKIPTRDLGGGG
jgi:hypothetical protein